MKYPRQGASNTKPRHYKIKQKTIIIKTLDLIILFHKKQSSWFCGLKYSREGREICNHFFPQWNTLEEDMILPSKKSPFLARTWHAGAFPGVCTFLLSQPSHTSAEKRLFFDRKKEKVTFTATHYLQTAANFQKRGKKPIKTSDIFQKTSEKKRKTLDIF